MKLGIVYLVYQYQGLMMYMVILSEPKIDQQVLIDGKWSKNYTRYEGSKTLPEKTKWELEYLAHIERICTTCVSKMRENLT